MEEGSRKEGERKKREGGVGEGKWDGSHRFYKSYNNSAPMDLGILHKGTP